MSQFRHDVTLYTIGYQWGRAGQSVQELIAVKTPVVDIRLEPETGKWDWQKPVLEQQLGSLYMWIENLGNDLHRQQSGAIQIHNLDAGMRQLEAVLSEYGRACLMCACASVVTCHRLTVANEAVKRFGVSVVHLPLRKGRAA